MISPRNKEQESLQIAKDTQISQADTVGFIRPSTKQPIQRGWVYQAIKELEKAEC